MRDACSDVHAVYDRPSGRRTAPWPLLHAVPVSDRTRTALCGARVGGAPRPWGRGSEVPAEFPTCPECAGLVQPLALHPA